MCHSKKVHCTLLPIELPSRRPSRVPILTPVHHWKCTMGMWMAELDLGAMGEGWLVQWVAFSFTSSGWPGKHAPFTWGSDGIKMYFEQSHGHLFDICHLLKHCCGPGTPLHGSGIPSGQWPWLPNSLDLSPVKYLRDVLEQEVQMSWWQCSFRTIYNRKSQSFKMWQVLPGCHTYYSE